MGRQCELQEYKKKPGCEGEGEKKQEWKMCQEMGGRRFKREEIKKCE